MNELFVQANVYVLMNFIYYCIICNSIQNSFIHHFILFIPITITKLNIINSTEKKTNFDD
jgi:hypothetical protein